MPVRYVRKLGGYALFFAAATWMAGTKVAALVVAAFVFAQLLHVCLVRPVFRAIRGAPITSPRNLALGGIGAIGSAAMVYFGYGALFGLGYAAAFAIDASFWLAGLAPSPPTE
jgi:hypothetical protein